MGGASEKIWREKEGKRWANEGTEEQMTGWYKEKMAGWYKDQMTGWYKEQMTGWYEKMKGRYEKMNEW
jgi:hypothetical protein